MKKTTSKDFYPSHEAALQSKTHAARRPSGVQSLAQGLWNSALRKKGKISDELFIAHESLIVAADEIEKLQRELAALVS
jgi:hypothetical protein